jgi:hypothetical protein
MDILKKTVDEIHACDDNKEKLLMITERLIIDIMEQARGLATSEDIEDTVKLYDLASKLRGL